ncbi:MAG: hypothetical protein IJU52_05690 [Clostridia bacterium]|nr:hypothetical protein [Clostridia bacterium]
MDAGLKTLLSLYKFSTHGKKPISEEEIALAKKEGYLFDYPKHESHSDTLNRLTGVLAQIDPKDIANAFLFSLSTRRLEYRSALGSYYYAKAVPNHEVMKSHNEFLAAHETDRCYLCGWIGWAEKPNNLDLQYGLNFLNYERYKDGGSSIGRIHLEYALFDLEQFLKLPKVLPAKKDIEIMKKILSCVDRLDDQDKAGKLRETITKAKIFKSNKDEVSVLLGELGICGILASKNAPSYDVFFADEYQRAPVESKNDFAYPVNRWHAKDGINYKKLKEVFGDIFQTR